MPQGYSSENDTVNKIRGVPGRSWRSFKAMDGRTPRAQRNVAGPGMTKEATDYTKDVEMLEEIRRQEEAVEGSNASGSGATRGVRHPPMTGLPL